MDIELIDPAGNTIRGEVNLPEDEVKIEDQHITIPALLLLGYTIRRADAVTNPVRLIEREGD